jgi:hypothetical protein
VITFTYGLVPVETRIGSAFGGLVYVIADEEAVQPKPFFLEFSDVCRIPSFSCSVEDGWGKSRTCECPWAEIHAKGVIFTLRTEVLQGIPSVSDAATRISELMDSLHEILAAPEAQAPQRVVFDVGIPAPGVVLGYPVFMAGAWAPIILGETGPTADVLQFMACMAVQAIPEGLLSPLFRGLLAMLASYHALRKTWPTATPIPQAQEGPSALWSEMLGLYRKYGPELYALVVQHVHGQDTAKSPRELADFIVGILAARTGGARNGLVDQITATWESTGTELDTIFGVFTMQQAGQG